MSGEDTPSWECEYLTDWPSVMIYMYAARLLVGGGGGVLWQKVEPDIS